MGFKTMTPPPADNFAARVFLGPALRAQPDRRLVDLVRDGYDAAFEEIVRRYRRPLDRFAAAIVGGRSEDVTQDAFSKALLALRGSEAEIELRPWLYRIVRNTALNDLRGWTPAAEEITEALPGARSAAAEAEAREELADLMERLRALPEPQRAALVMRELEGLSHEEIAAALGLSGGAARQAIYRARTKLRDGLGLLVPLPLLRVLADNGGEAVAAGGAVLGGSAIKAGMATVLVAGAVGAGVAVEQRGGSDRGPAAAQAAPVAPGVQATAPEGAAAPEPGGGRFDDTSRGDDGSRGRDGADDDGREGEDGGDRGRGSGHSGGERHDDDDAVESESEEDRSGSSGSGDDEAEEVEHEEIEGDEVEEDEVEPVEEPEVEAAPVEELEIEDSSGSGSDSSGPGSGGDPEDD